MRASRRLVIGQSYVPQYRAAFFAQLDQLLSTDGVQLEVVIPDRHQSGDPQRTRNDEAGATHRWLSRHQPAFARDVRGRWVYSLGRALRPGPGDAVVVGLQATLPDAWRLLLTRRRDYGVGLWGHVGAFVAPANRADVAAERWLMRHSDHVFAYTEEGADLARRDVPARQVTAVGNSVDTAYVNDPHRHAVAQELRARFKLTDDRYLAYIGGLDQSKRIDFLAASLDELQRLDPGVKVLVAGDGQDRHLLGPAEARGQLIRLGFGADDVKGALSELCTAILIPGRVGLVAVDALAMGRPLVTVEGSRHGPEHAYLVEGDSVLTSADDPVDFARTAHAALSRPRQSWSFPTLDEMVLNFARGAMQLLDEAQKRRSGSP